MSSATSHLDSGAVPDPLELEASDHRQRIDHVLAGIEATCGCRGLALSEGALDQRPVGERGPRPSDSAVRAADTEALIVLNSRAVAAQQRRGSGLLITAAMPVPIAWLAAAGLGEDRRSKPTFSDDGALTVTVAQVYAGKVLATREERPAGEPARVAIRDLILAGRVMKGHGLRKTLNDRYDLVALAAQIEADAPLPALPEWLLARLSELGVEGADDLALLEPEDLLPEAPNPEVVRTIEHRFPRTLNVGDARYEIEYQVAARKAIFHQVSGSRKQAPSPMHLPRLPGFRTFWEHKNRVRAIRGRK